MIDTDSDKLRIDETIWAGPEPREVIAEDLNDLAYGVCFPTGFEPYTIAVYGLASCEEAEAYETAKAWILRSREDWAAPAAWKKFDEETSVCVLPENRERWLASRMTGDNLGAIEWTLLKVDRELIRLIRRMREEVVSLQVKFGGSADMTLRDVSEILVCGELKEVTDDRDTAWLESLQTVSWAWLPDSMDPYQLQTLNPAMAFDDRPVKTFGHGIQVWVSDLRITLWDESDGNLRIESVEELNEAINV